MNIKIETEPRTTLVDIKKDVKYIKNRIANELGLNRDEFVFPNGLITLRGYSKTTDSWSSLTNVIGDFNNHIKKEDYTHYKLYCHVQTKKRRGKRETFGEWVYLIYDDCVYLHMALCFLCMVEREGVHPLFFVF